MSGGSYNYLCFKDADNILSGDGLSDLESMVKRLSSLGYADAAKEADILYQYILHARIVVGNRMKHLEPVFHAVEWCDSGDSSLDSVKEAVEKWRSQ